MSANFKDEIRKMAAAKKAAAEAGTKTEVTPTAVNGGDDLKKKNLPAGQKETPVAGEKSIPAGASAGAVTDDAPAAAVPTTVVKGARDIIASLKSGAAATPAAAPAAAPTPAAAEPAKLAGADAEVAFGIEALLKVAHAVLSFEDGVKFAKTALQRQAGAAAAEETLMKVASLREQAEQAAYAHAQQAAQLEEMQKVAYARGAAEAEMAEKIASLPEAEQQMLARTFALHQKNASTITSDLSLTPEEREIALLSYDMGTKLAAAMLESLPDDANLEDPAVAEQMAVPGEGEEISDEDILVAIEQLVASGQLDEATAAALLQEVAGDAGAGDEAVAELGEEEDPQLAEMAGKAASLAL